MKQKYLKILTILLSIIAYGYLFYRLFTFSDYAVFCSHFTSLGITQWLILILVIALFPLNIFFESVKWRTLLKNIAPISYKEAWNQTCFGFVGAFITPNRLGDYPSRVTLLENQKCWISAITLGFVGTFAMDLIIALLGLPAVLIFFMNNFTGTYHLWWIIFFFLLYIILMIFFKPIIRLLLKRIWKKQQFNRILLALNEITFSNFIVISFQSLLRYIVWFIQLIFILNFCGVQLTINQALIAILSYYCLITITPSIPIADIAIRGSWSIIIFSTFVPNEPAIAMAVTLIWLINTILPMIIGSFYSLQIKYKRENLKE